MEATPEISFLTLLLPLAGVLFVIAVGVFLLNQQFQKNLYRQKLEREELRNKHQTELLNSNIKVQESERKRIAKDLHDELGATLSIAKMQLLRLEQMYPSVGSEDLSIEKVRNIIESSISSVRQISHDLMPNQLETFGLIRTLESLVYQVNESNQVEIGLHISNGPFRFSWEKELSLYRIFTELIQNTLKHSGANNIEISFMEKDSIVLIEYQDDGVGMPKDTVYGLGLKSMEARIKAMGGSIELRSGSGFRANLKVPI